MNSHLRKDLENLKIRIVKVAVAVEEILNDSVRALESLSEEAAKKVCEADTEIDKMEVETEEECLKILALHQPVASDLRFVITVLKINNELEHIADMATNIAKRIGFLKCEEKANIPFDLKKMSAGVSDMLGKSIGAFLREDESLAIAVCESDETIDDENKSCYGNVKRAIATDSKNAMAQINYLLVSKAFERIADLCTNIAEDIIYMKHSIIARHNLDAAINEIEESKKSNQ